MDIERELRFLSDALVERIPEVAEAIHGRLRLGIPNYYSEHNPELAEADRRSIEGAITEIFEALGRGRTLPQGLYGPAVDEARLAAQAGINLHDLLRTRRIGQAISWETILEVGEELIKDAQTRIAVLKVASDYQFEWNDRVAEAVVETYQHEREAMVRDHEHRKRELIRDLLKGLPVDSGKLAYNIHGGHLGLVAWGMSPAEAFEQIASLIGGQTMTVIGSGGVLHGWIGGESPLKAIVEATTHLKLPDETWVALGEPARDLDGFRLTHEEALRAFSVARMRSDVITPYRKVALEALMIKDFGAAREFVQMILGPLDGDHPRDNRLRDTLTAYFRTGQNAAAAAHLVGVHERTIAYRLRSIEELLGKPIATEREELAVALRIRDLIHQQKTDLDHDSIATESDKSRISD